MIGTIQLMAGPPNSKQQRLKMIGEYLTAFYRERLNADHKFTVSAWARELGVAQSNLTQMMDGDLNIGATNLERITKALGRYRLYDIAGHMRPDVELWRLLEYWDDLSAEDRRELIDLAKVRAAQNRG